MATPYLGLDTSAPVAGPFNLNRMNSNTQKIEEALYRKRADLPDRVQVGSDWFTLARTNKDWDVYTEDSSGNKIVRHGVWAMVEVQFITKRAVKVNSSGNITNQHILTLGNGYQPMGRIALGALNSDLDATVEFHPNGNCYITALNFTSTTIPKGTVLRIGGRYVFNP